MRHHDLFHERRQRGNEAVFRHGDLTLKRFFALDQDAYTDGALPAQTKELLGLTASLVLRCDDCVAYHLDRARRLGVPAEQIMEAMTVALVVGGSIVIPHLRAAVIRMEEEESDG